MTAKSETVGVDSVWITRVDVGTDNECSFVCHLLDPGAVEFVPESALAKALARVDVWKKCSDKQALKIVTLLSGLEALAGELERTGRANWTHPKREAFANRLRALIPAAANTESEE